MVDSSCADGSRPGSSSDVSFATATTRESVYSQFDGPDKALEEVKLRRDDATVVERPSTARRISQCETLCLCTADEPDRANSSVRDEYKLDDRFPKVHADQASTEAAASPHDRDAEVKQLREELQTRNQGATINTAPNEEAQQSRIAELEILLENANSDLVKMRAKVDNLEDTFLDHEIRRRELVDQVDEHKRLLEEARLEASSQRTEVSKLLQDHKAIVSERDEFKVLLQDALACTTALEQKIHNRQRRPSTRGDGSAKARNLSKVAEEKLEFELAQRNEELAEIRVQVLSMQQQLSQSESRAMEMEEALEAAKAEAAHTTDEERDKVTRLERRIVELEQTHMNQLAQLEAERALLETSISHSTSNDEQNRQIAVQQAVDASKAASAAEIVALKQSHDCEIARLTRELERGAEERIAQLAERHEAAMAAALADADDDMEERLRDQANAHEERLEALQQSVNAELSEMQAQLEEAEVQQQAQMQSVEESSQRAIEDLRERLRIADVNSTDMSTKHDALLEELSTVKRRLDSEITARAEADAKTTNLSAKYDAVLQELSALRSQLKIESAARTESESFATNISAKHGALVEEVSALQARLDAEFTAHAEAERALADMRKRHRASLGDKKVDDDTKEALQRRLVVLQAECDNLSALNEALVSQTPNAQVPALSPARKSFAEEKPISEEARKLQAQNAELSRQNEFLVKELEEAMARVAARRAEECSTDVAVQTEPVLGRSTSSHKNRVSKDSPRAAVSRLQHMRLNSRTERATKARSLDDALHRARAEPSNLNNVISANEALFELKIHEHVGNIKVVKDQLANEFQQKFAALLSDRDEMEKKVTAKTAAEFAKERRDLFASYGVSREESISEFSAPTRRALQDAEGRLVAEFDRRVSQRKGRIALKHVADIQSLTEDYDRKIAELLNNRADSIAEPSRTPQPEAQQRHESLNGRERAMAPNREPHRVTFMENTVETAATPFSKSTPKAYNPTRTVASAPKTQATIPRAVPFSGRPYVTQDPNSTLRVRTGGAMTRSNNQTPPHSDGQRTPTLVPSLKDEAVSPRTRGGNLNPTSVETQGTVEKDPGGVTRAVRTAKSTSRLAAKSTSATPKQSRSLYSSGAIYMRAQQV